MLVERPLPWPADIADAPDIAEVAEAVHGMAAGRRCRVQTVIGVGHSAPEGRRRVLCYWASTERFDGFQGAEVEVDADEIAVAAASLMTEAGRLERRSADIGVSDVLVCGHGARDRCCGAFGTRLAMELGESQQTSRPQQPGLPEAVRLWRTSHTGGHRFAPTAIVLPYGDVWGYLDAATLGAILRQDVEPRDVIHRYRGSAGMSSPALQLLDRFALSVEGWRWRTVSRRAAEAPLPNGAVSVQIEDTVGAVRFEGIVDRKRTLALPLCGGAAGELGKPVEELALLAAADRSTR